MIDAFLKLVGSDGKLVEGESTDRTFAKLIEIRDFSMGEKTAVAPPAPDETPQKPTFGPRTWADVWSSDVASEMDERLKKIVQERDKQGRAHAHKEMWQNQPKKWEDAREFLKTAVKRERGLDEPDEEAGRKRLKFAIVKDVDAASADLFQASCATADTNRPVTAKNRKIGEFKSATITLRKMYGGEAKPYLVCTFTNVAIDGYSLSFDSGRAHLYERVTFVFQDYRIDYRPQTEAGNVGKSNPIKEGSLGEKKKGS